MSNPSSNHSKAVDENLKFFTKDFIQKYDSADTSKKLSKLIPHILLQYPNLSSISSLSPIPDKHPLVNDMPFPQESPVFQPNKILLDFACGTGVITKNLQPYVNQIIGVDINQYMLEEFQRKIPESQIMALDILKDDISHLKQSVDIIICSIGYHHLEDYQAITIKLAELLKPQGKLFIVDFYNDDIEGGNDPSSNLSPADLEAVRHMGGLKKQSLIDTLMAAKLSDIFVDKVAQVEIWQPEQIFKYHIKKAVAENLEALEKRDNGEYLIPTELVLAVGTKD